jgi:hypothetical protein
MPVAHIFYRASTACHCPSQSDHALMPSPRTLALCPALTCPQLTCPHLLVKFCPACPSERTWTSTDAGYLSFFVGMHAIALLLGPFTYTQEALEVAVGG